MPNTDNFHQIKRDLVDRITKIEEFIKQTESDRNSFGMMMKDVQKKLTGDYTIYPPLLGHEQRIIDLEKLEKERLKNKEAIIKMAVGSLTIAIGGAVIWVFDVLRGAFIHK